MMHTTRLEPRPTLQFWGQRVNRLSRMFVLCFLLTTTTGIAYGLWDHWQRQAQLNELEWSVAQIEMVLNAASVAAKSSAPTRITPASSRNLLQDVENWTPEQFHQINGLIRQLNTPWHDLFNQLENDTTIDIALISVEPDARRGSLRLQAEGKNLETLLIYTAMLQHNGVLGRLSYSRHETNEQDSNKPIRLSVEYELRVPDRIGKNPALHGEHR